MLVLWWGRCLLCTLNGLRCNDPTYINGQSSKCFPLWMMRREGKWAALSFLLQKQCLWQFCWLCSPIPVAVRVLYFPSSPDQAFIPSFSPFLSRTFCPGRKRLVWGFLECCWLFRCPGHQACSEVLQSIVSLSHSAHIRLTLCELMYPYCLVCRDNVGRIRGALFLNK